MARTQRDKTTKLDCISSRDRLPFIALDCAIEAMGADVFAEVVREDGSNRTARLMVLADDILSVREDLSSETFQPSMLEAAREWVSRCANDQPLAVTIDSYLSMMADDRFLTDCESDNQ